MANETINSLMASLLETRQGIGSKMNTLGIPNASSNSTLAEIKTAMDAVSNSSASATSLNCGASATIPVGYVKNAITVSANSLSSQTGVDSDKTAATAATILSGYQAWVNGSKVSGTMTNRGTGSTTTLNGTTTSKTINAGYWSSNNVVKVNTMAAPTVTLTSSEQTITCKDKMMTGNITVPAVNFYYTGSTVPAVTGYNDGDIFLII